MKLPKQVTREQLQDALSNKGDYEIPFVSRDLRRRFKNSVCRNLFGMRAESVQKKLWK